MLIVNWKREDDECGVCCCCVVGNFKLMLIVSSKRAIKQALLENYGFTNKSNFVMLMFCWPFVLNHDDDGPITTIRVSKTVAPWHSSNEWIHNYWYYLVCVWVSEWVTFMTARRSDVYVWLIDTHSSETYKSDGWIEISNTYTHRESSNSDWLFVCLFVSTCWLLTEREKMMNVEFVVVVLLETLSWCWL